MKKRLFLISIFLSSFISSFSQSLLENLKFALDNRFLNIARNNWSSNIYNSGNFTIREVDDNNSREIIVYGSITYRSENCGSVKTNYEATFKKILDGFEITKVCIHIPYCVAEIEFNRVWKCY